MAFRQNNHLEHKRFLKNYQEELLQLGIPLPTLEYEAWMYLLSHGNCIRSKWSVDKLNNSQAKRLLKIVETYKEGVIDSILTGDIRRKIQTF